MENVWYKIATYEYAKELVKENLVNTVTSFIASGYWLKYIRDCCDYKKDGYQSLWECAEAEFGLKVSEASRAMSMNDKYSTDGNSPFMDESYKQYNKSQLQEMLTMSDGQIEQVTPDMTVKAIRKIKNQKPEDSEEKQESLKEQKEDRLTPEMFCDVATDSVNTESEGDLSDDAVEDVLTEIEMVPEQEEPLNVEFDTGELMKELEDDVVDGEYIEVPEDVRKADEASDGSNEKATEPEKLSAYGLCKNEYPEGSLITTKGCGHKYSCFMCAHKCDIRQEMLYCVDAPLGNPFGCTTMDVLENINDDIGDRCQFINLDMAEHSALNNIPEPCCKKCQMEDCGYRCQISASAKYITKNDSIKTLSESGSVAESDNHELSAIKQLLKKKNEELGKYLECEGIPEDTIFEKKTIVGALANMVCELENIIEEENTVEVEQSELPKFKNNGQRKAWLEDIEAWGLWYEDKNINARYYKYDFPDGSRLIAVKYKYTCPPWLKDTKDKELDGSYKNAYYHMLYSEEYRKTHKYEYEEYYTHATVSVSALVEFIKEITKRLSG